MRILTFMSGPAVLFPTLAYGRIIHHILTVQVRGDAPSRAIGTTLSYLSNN
jgi:hypothetical protein